MVHKVFKVDFVTIREMPNKIMFIILISKSIFNISSNIYIEKSSY